MPALFSPAPIRKVFDDLDHAKPAWHLALGGIMGDAKHFAEGGYHVPRSHVPASDYSVQLADDRKGNPDAASALDITPNGSNGKAVMRQLTQNLQAATKRQDPRIATCVREFAGTLDNQRVFSMDVRTNRVVTGFDSGHLYHVHISFIRRYANDAQALAGVADVLAGKPLEENPLMADKLSPTVLKQFKDLIDERVRVAFEADNGKVWGVESLMYEVLESPRGQAAIKKATHPAPSKP